jgi:hypothetical protein
MVTANLYSWKQVKEGLRRGDIGPLIQTNEFIVNISVQGYRADNEIQMCMVTDADGTQTFLVTQPILDSASYIYIPTDEEVDEWEELGLDITQEIAKREG